MPTPTRLSTCTALLMLAALVTSCSNETAPSESAAPEMSEHTLRLLEAARQEGSVTVYSSLPVHIMTDVANAFREKYDLPIEVWRGGSEEILQRSVAEARAGRHLVDIVESAAPEVEAIAREGLLTGATSPVFAELMPGSYVEGRDWINSRLIVFVGAYNTNEISASDAPPFLHSSMKSANAERVEARASARG